MRVRTTIIYALWSFPFSYLYLFTESQFLLVVVTIAWMTTMFASERASGND